MSEDRERIYSDSEVSDLVQKALAAGLIVDEKGCFEELTIGDLDRLVNGYVQ